MESNVLKQKTDNLEVLHPSFYQYLVIFAVPLAFLSLLVLEINALDIVLGVCLLELFLFLNLWIFLATTTYIIKSDRIEIRTGILVKRSSAIPYDKIVNLTCRQNLFQRFFKIGNIFIELPGVDPFEIPLTGIERHEEVAELLFALKKKNLSLKGMA
jgi:uncharacterized membrane protein YdbT with pleckstrin-like domain